MHKRTQLTQVLSNEVQHEVVVDDHGGVRVQWRGGAGEHATDVTREEGSIALILMHRSPEVPKKAMSHNIRCVRQRF